jgi:hypothetical protein
MGGSLSESQFYTSIFNVVEQQKLEVLVDWLDSSYRVVFEQI